MKNINECNHDSELINKVIYQLMQKEVITQEQANHVEVEYLKETIIKEIKEADVENLELLRMIKMRIKSIADGINYFIFTENNTEYEYQE